MESKQPPESEGDGSEEAARGDVADVADTLMFNFSWT